jgi:cell division protein FtsA
MNNINHELYIEINDSNYIFFVGEMNEHNNFKIIHKSEVHIEKIEKNTTLNLKKNFNLIKENIYIIEQKLNFTFKELVLILDNLSTKYINLTGFKKLNGSQISRENITYILNTLKSCVDEIEFEKTILHIFNSRFYLDNKEIYNLPVGLFGDFYAHEMSFVLINTNDYKNLKNIFDKCNLKIKKIFTKSFIEGAYICEKKKNIKNFFQIKINQKNSKIFYYENNSLKFEQLFNFGTDIIIKDISKITSLNLNIIKNIIKKIKLKDNIAENELIEENLLINCKHKKIKKKLIYDIALARINEIFEIILFKNINFKYYKNFCKDIFLDLDDKPQSKCFEKIYSKVCSEYECHTNLTDSLFIKNTFNTVNKLVHYGWKSEAIPLTQSKKSLIARIFDAIFA